MREVEWIRCGAAYCNLETVDLSNVTYLGVYVIWHSPSGQVVYVGQGLINQRLSAHRNDSNILRYRASGSLLATWTSEPDEETRLGIERYLGELWEPLVSKSYSVTASPIVVNTP